MAHHAMRACGKLQKGIILPRRPKAKGQATRLSDMAHQEASVERYREDAGRPMQDAATIAVKAPESRGAERLRIIWRNVFPFLVVGAIWEVVARLEVFPRRLFPTLGEVAAAIVDLTIRGILPHHAFETVLRLASGFVIAAVLGISIGIAMGRSRRAEDILLPLVSMVAPIPGIAYAPLFLLWFGLGNFASVLLVGVVSSFAVIFNTWTGVKAVKEIWVRSAQSMGANDRRMFWHVILPGSLP